MIGTFYGTIGFLNLAATNEMFEFVLQIMV